MEPREHRFEMALTLAEMRRLAPHLDPAHPVVECPDGVDGRFAGETHLWRLRLAAPRQRAIGLIRFPIADVTLRLDGFDDDLERRFLARFHLVFRKGGG